MIEATSATVAPPTLVIGPSSAAPTPTDGADVRADAPCRHADGARPCPPSATVGTSDGPTLVGVVASAGGCVAIVALLAVAALFLAMAHRRRRARYRRQG